MNDHIVPDEIDSQQLQENEDKNDFQPLEERQLWHCYSGPTLLLLFQGAILVELHRKSTSNYD